MGRARPGAGPHATLDDLLRAGEEPPRRRRAAPTGWDWLVRRALFALWTAAAGYLVLHQAGYTVPYPLLACGVFALSALRRALSTVAAPSLPALTAPPRPHGPAAPPEDVADGLFLAMSRWDTRLGWSERDPARFASTVQPRLADVVDELLRLRHGFSRSGDPARARALLGEPLWSLLHQPVGRTPAPHELAAIVERMEAL
jgi:hypothetical protein